MSASHTTIKTLTDARASCSTISKLKVKTNYLGVLGNSITHSLTDKHAPSSLKDHQLIRGSG